MSCLSNYEISSIPASLKQLPSSVRNKLIPYFEHEKIYFMSDEIILNTLSRKNVEIPIDYTVCFDTNFASYIGTIVRGGDLKENNDSVISILDSLIYHDINFDHLFYLAENIKQVRKTILDKEGDSLSSHGFWKTLKKYFRWNLVALELFREINCKHYKKTSVPKSNLSFRHAFKQSIENTYRFYASKQGREFCGHIIENQRVILLLLIKIISIQFKSGKKERVKLTELLEFMHNKIGAYFDREAMIATIYYIDRNMVPFLSSVSVGCRQTRLLKKLDNLAWDIVSVRFIEQIMAYGGEGQFFVPYFLTLDSKLAEIYGLYRVKAVIFDDESGVIIPIPVICSADFLENHNLMKIADYFVSVQ